MKKLFLGRVVFAFIVIFLFSACAHKKYKFEYEHQYSQNTTQLDWPQSPEKTRYRYVGEIVGEVNFKEIEGSEGSLRKSLNWLSNFIFGAEPPKMIYRPQGGAFDNKNKRLFVTDIGRKEVLVFDLASGRINSWEGGGGEQSFKTPIAVVIINNEQVLVTDADLGFVLRFDSQGKYLGALGKKKLSRPTGITYDPDSKKIFIADSQTHEIHVFSENGEWLSVFGGKGAKDGKFNSPTHLAFANSILYVSDTLNARVQLFNADGKWLSSFGKRGLKVGNMPRPKGIAVDSDANIYVVESYYDHLLMFNQKGEGLLAIGGTGQSPGQFNLPAGVWVDDMNRVYVSDMFNQRIVVFQYLSE